MRPGGSKDNKAPPSLAEKMNDGAEKTLSLFSSSCIYRVPKVLRKLNESSYTPCLIAIGPLHRHNKQLRKQMQIMQDVKMYYTNRLLHRRVKGIKDGKPVGEKMGQVLQDCVEKMKERVDEAKECYADEEVRLKDNNEMLEMMLFDGCFILELLYISHCRCVEKSEDEEKGTTKEGDGGNAKALSSRVPPLTKAGEGGSSSVSSPTKAREGPSPTKVGEDGNSSCGEQDPLLDKVGEGGSSSAPSPTNEREGGSSSCREQDPILDNLLTAANVKHDLLLLENQIPFFVLDELFKLTVAKIQGEDKVSLNEYVVSYFKDIMSPIGEKSGSKTKSSCSPSDCVLWVSCGSTQENEANAKNYNHILHLLHSKYGPKKTAKKKFRELEVCASDLDHVGVEFVKGDKNNLFDVEFEGPVRWFHGATLEIPTLSIHDPTETFFRNLIAFEQCCRCVSPDFTSYAKLMDMLINSEEDVQVLRKAEIIHNYLSKDKDVTKLFNNLCKEIVIGDFHFSDMCQEASEYSKSGWPKFRGKLKGTYFASTWSKIGFCVVCIAFGIQITSFAIDITSFASSFMMNNKLYFAS